MDAFQAALDSGRSADYFITGYLGSLSLGVGSASESGTVELPYSSTMKLKDGFEYGGAYLEPGVALVGNDLFLVGANCGIVFGTAGFTPEGRSAPYEADVRGYLDCGSSSADFHSGRSRSASPSTFAT